MKIYLNLECKNTFKGEKMWMHSSTRNYVSANFQTNDK